MIFSVTAPVVSRSTSDSVQEMKFDSATVSLIPDDDGIISEVKAQKRVPDYEEYIGKVRTVKPGRHEIKIPDNPHLEEILDIFQRIESFGYFWLNIRKVLFRDLRWRWNPESRDEKLPAGVSSIRHRKTYDRGPTPLDPEEVVGLMSMMEDHPELNVSFAWFREGSIAFVDFRYADAFNKFYFVVEDLYGGGNTKNSKIEKAFKNSEKFRRAVAGAKEILDNDDGRHKEALLKRLQEENRKFDLEGLIGFIVNTRGSFHHFNRDNTHKKVTPFNQDEYESVAFLMKTIVLNVLLLEAEGSTLSEVDGSVLG